MASNYYGAPQYHSALSNHPHNHHGRSRRGPRISSQNAHRQYKAQRSPKEVNETPTYTEYLQRLEAAKSFEFDDDELFCPFHLLTEGDLQSIHSASSSDRGSLSSGSPEGSPLQQQAHPNPSFLLSSTPHAYNPTPPGYQSHTHTHTHTQSSASHAQMKLHQPMALRTRNAIPIVDPSTRSVASPPRSVSPGAQMQQQQQQQQYVSRRW